MLEDDVSAIWNRACEWDAPAIRTHEGDAALHVALTFHGSVENGGLLDAVENYGTDSEYPLPRVLSAFRFLGLDDVAGAIESARREFEELAGTPGDHARLESAERRLGASYVLDPGRLESAVRARLVDRPQSFAPVH